MSRHDKPASATALEAPPPRARGSANPAPTRAAAASVTARASSMRDPAGARQLVSRWVAFFSSLRLTVVLLALGIVLIFWGTLAQVDLGLFKAQNEFFRSFFVYWQPKGSSWRIPIFPAGYLLGGLLLVNLVTAHFTRFKLTRKKVGIWMVHIGIILLLAGQLLTDLLSRESQMWLSEGQSKSYSDSSARSELAVIDSTDPAFDDVVAFSEALVSRKRDLHHPKLPFTIKVRHYFVNSEPQLRGPMVSTSPPQATRGIAQRIQFNEEPATAKMDARNIPAAVVEVVTDKDTLGTWVVSNWVKEEKLVQLLRRNFHKQLGESLAAKLDQTLDQPQQFSYQGRTWQLELRPVRFYKPFNIQLLKFSHDIYRGTDIPKNFSSRIRLQRPDSNEDREVPIYMNHPLRYAGETFYQASFDDLDPRVTILQVVHNPSWLTPYFSCVMVVSGLLVQFLTHLIGFTRKRRAA